MSSENFDGTKVDGSNLGIVWERVAQFVKLITGDVNVTKDGNLLEQIKNINTDGMNQQMTEQIEESLKIIGAVDDSLSNMQMSFLQLAMVVQTMTDADVIDSDNVAVELFNTEDDVIITSGYYDGENKRLYA
jgi:hypothetical protein